MKHEEFQIGMEFWCGNYRWRCTDIGTRTIIGIRLGPHEIVNVIHLKSGTATTRTTNDDDSWFAGPPYAVQEEVFDEYDTDGCSITPGTD